MNRFGKYGMAAVILIVVGAILLGASWVLNKKDITNYSTTNANYQQKVYVCEKEVNNLIVEETSNDVSVEVVPGIDRVKVTYYVCEKKLEYDITEEKGTLKVKRKSNKNPVNINIIGIDFSDPYVKVEVPEKSCEDVEISCSSGNVRINGIKAENISASATSGGVRLSDINAKYIDFGATSGAVLLENSEADKIKAVATSGTIMLKNVKTDKYSGGTTSGTNVLENVEAKRCEVSSTSGGTRFDNLKSEDINIGATSGSVKGTIDGNEADYAIATKTTSGSSNMNDKTKGQYSVDISTTSGSIKVSFNK